MNEHQGAPGRHHGRLRERGELDCGAGESFHAVDPTRVEQHAARAARAKARYIDRQGQAGRSARLDRDLLELRPGRARRLTKACACGGVVR
jgi:hypothetical protein